MNVNHQRLCPSPEWAAYIRAKVLPSLVAEVDLGGEMLEIGPGPGAATDWLRHRVHRLVAVEIDPAAASELAARFRDTNVEVSEADATATTFADSSFDSAGAFTMLHHVATSDAQDEILAEIFRVLRPGGVLIGSDSLASRGLRQFHVGDTYNPVDPGTLTARLEGCGFEQIVVTSDRMLRFIARRPEQG